MLLMIAVASLLAASPQEDLFAAIKAGDAAAVTRLVDADRALLSARSPKGVSTVTAALFRLAKEDFFPPATNDVLQLLLQRGAPVDRIEAAAIGDVARLQRELAADPKYLEAESFGWTPLHFAAFGGKLENASFLLDRGAPIDRPANTKFKNTALQISLLSGQVEMMKMLVKRGADVRYVQAEGITVLHAAAVVGSEDAVAALLAAGADPEVRSKNGKTAAQMARERGHERVAALIERAGRTPPRSGKGF